MERPILFAYLRNKTGKGVARKLRSNGIVPAIFYGPRTENIPLAVDLKELNKTLQTEAGENVLVDLEIKNGDKSSRKIVMIKDIQIDVLYTKP